MSSNPLDSFRASDGSTTSAGQQNAGLFEKQQGWAPALQQSWETASAYQQRLVGCVWLTNDGNN